MNGGIIMVTKSVDTQDRCAVGYNAKNNTFSVWHKVMGKGTRPRFVKEDKLAQAVAELIELYKASLRE